MSAIETPTVSADDPEGWDVLGPICEGLAFGPRTLRAAVRPVAERYDLGPRGPWILNLIDRGQVFPRDLAAAFRIGRSLITAELARLAAAGLISTRPGEGDRRRTELALTESGRAECRLIREEMARIVSGNLARYSSAQLRMFATMLREARGEDGGAGNGCAEPRKR